MSKFIAILISIMMATVSITASPVHAQNTFSCLDVNEIPQAECEALVALYNSTHGDNWTNKLNWFVTNTPSNWQYLTVGDGHITHIYLSENNLSGSLPSEIGNLSQLVVLYLDYNLISGVIPASIGNLSQIQRLYLSHNQFSGSLPPELGNLTNLILLYLQDNQFTGSIPPEISNLTKLWHLLLYDNQLTGAIPPQLGVMTELQSLVLSNNQLTGVIPPSLGNLANLQSLRLSGNLLSGAIPETLGNLGNLDTLVLSTNHLSGPLPPSLGSLSNLSTMELQINYFSGSLPLSFTGLSKLERLYFTDTHLCEPADASFGAWKETVLTWSGTGLICAGSYHQITGHIRDTLNVGVGDVPIYLDGIIYSISDPQGHYAITAAAGQHTLVPDKFPLVFTPFNVNLKLSSDFIQDFVSYTHAIHLPLVTR